VSERERQRERQRETETERKGGKHCTLQRSLNLKTLHHVATDIRTIAASWERISLGRFMSSIPDHLHEGVDPLDSLLLIDLETRV
jgi:hypothetical protein